MSPVRRVSIALVALLVGATGTTGCAAARAGLQVQDAIAARDAALEAGADTQALYEYTMAERYLEKAWEEMGTGQYRMSVELSKKSAEWADQAVVQIERGARAVDVDLRDIHDDPGAVPHPEVPPAPEVEPQPETAPDGTPAPTDGPIEPDDAPVPTVESPPAPMPAPTPEPPAAPPEVP